MTDPIADGLVKDPVLDPAQDFYSLRRDGIGFIQQLGSELWTDYNIHDPGITLLEATCYVVTDLAYRMGWNIQDLLAPAMPDPSAAFPNQAFFSARNILSVRATTPDDLRRILIDLASVRNAWIRCKSCACETRYFAWCDPVSGLTLGFEKPANATPPAAPVWARGTYDALLELDVDPVLGDLNDRKVESSVVSHDAAGAHTTTVELRFPDLGAADPDGWRAFLGTDAAFNDTTAFSVTLTQMGAAKNFDLFAAFTTDEKRDEYVRAHWRSIFYLSFEVEIPATALKFAIAGVACRIFSDATTRSVATARGLKGWFEDRSRGGFIRRFRDKSALSRTAVDAAKAALCANRSLDEDICKVGIVGVDDVAVCADVEVAPDADIEAVQAQIWFEIQNYFNPPLRFYSLKELLDQQQPTEAIFNGPPMASGFVTNEDLRAAELLTELRVSDILDRLMAIDGIISVNQLSLTKYDSEGNTVAGAADPTWQSGEPVFDSTRVSAFWLLFVTPQHQPRLYLNGSRFLFYKNGLPFRARVNEAIDTLNALRGAAERPKFDATSNDIPIPAGTYRHPDEYFPILRSLPSTYGVGPDGLPLNASPLRRAQAKQLKAYLLAFEQLFANAFAQLAHTADLFSLDPQVKRTYFVAALDDVIPGFGELKQASLNTAAIEAISETDSQFLERRNRFLDHLLARFGEEFGDYALLLGNVDGVQVARGKLIADKIAFLKAYPRISRDRGSAFNYSKPPAPDNRAGIQERVSLLMGFPDLQFTWTAADAGGGMVALTFLLADPNGETWLDGALSLAAGDVAQAIDRGRRAVVEQMIDASSYQVVPAAGSQYQIKLDGPGAVEWAHSPAFPAQADAQARRDEMVDWSANDRVIVVEHLLLRPKFPGDALYPVCEDGACGICGGEDPYSFRLTFVMPGWAAQYTDNLELRGYADRTIRQETPAHLLSKICWVGNDGFGENPCDPVVDALADLVTDKGVGSAGGSPDSAEACVAANAIYHAFSRQFSTWYVGQALDYVHPQGLTALIAARLAVVTPADVGTATVLDAFWSDIVALMVAHFVDVALRGWQFERFEAAWLAWLQVNSGFDWAEERLHERTEAILRANLQGSVTDEALCECVDEILAHHGAAFHSWLDENLRSGRSLADLTVFVAPTPTLSAGLNFKTGGADAVAQMLGERYGAYTEVSYRLWIVVLLLGQLRNTYPAATLHDCDDGSDVNPVRLDNTTLGNHPLRGSLT